MKKLKILGIGLAGGAAKYRLWQIQRLLKKREHEFVCTSYAIGFPVEVAKLCDIIILQMVNDPKIAKRVKKLGKKLVYEADDYYKVRKDGSMGSPDIGKVAATEETKKEEERRMRGTEECIKMADLVTVTTFYLKKKLSHLNKNIAVLPNYLDIETWLKPRKNNSRTLRIGWAGSISHKADLEQILNPVIKEVIKRHPEVRFVYCGYGGMSSTDKLTQLEYGEDMFKGIPRKNREYLLGVNTPFWPVKASALEFDIALAPLIDDEFNRSKSNLKYLEYGLLGYPGVYSPTIYKETVKHGETGFIAKTKEDWIKYIDLLIEDEELRNKIRDNARKDVLKNWDLKDHIEKWERSYLSLFPDREDETKAKGIEKASSKQ